MVLPSWIMEVSALLLIMGIVNCNGAPYLKTDFDSDELSSSEQLRASRRKDLTADDLNKEAFTEQEQFATAKRLGRMASTGFQSPSLPNVHSNYRSQDDWQSADEELPELRKRRQVAGQEKDKVNATKPTLVRQDAFDHGL